MTLRGLLAAILLAGLLGAASSARAAPGRGGRNVPDLSAVLPHPDDTHCERCHSTSGWSDVSFAHERTGFPLRGAHAHLSCKACHEETYTKALGQTCGSCHRDIHQGRLGTRCAGCHDETTWVSHYDADVHRRNNFPLRGRHAFIACEECHGDRRDRGFTRINVACNGCHLQDLAKTRGTAIDHQVLGFSNLCQKCHLPWRWKGAGFPQHDTCFQLTGSPHLGIPCLSCHTALVSATVTGQCSTGTAACTRCHACARHPAVPGFACVERQCYQCHPFNGSGSGALRAITPRSP
jgi:hypothetical protein